MVSQGYLRSKERIKDQFCAQLVPMGLALIVPGSVLAASFESSLQSLVNGIVGRILPLVAFYYAGEAAVHWIQNRPDSKDRASRVAVGTIALLGINGVWSWLQSHIK